MIWTKVMLSSVALLPWLAGEAQATEPVPYSLLGHPSQDGRCRGDAGKGDLDRSEAACLDQLAGVAERREGTLSLRLQNGERKVYTNRTAGCDEGEGGECIKYQLTGYFPEHGLLLIEVGYYEGVRWRLVRTTNGEETTILAPPHYSPGHTWLVAVSWSEGPSGSGNGIDIVPSVPSATAHEWHYEVPVNIYTLYDFVGWDGDDRVKLTVTFRAGAEMKTLPASVERINGTWQLKRSGGTSSTAQ